MLINLCLCPPLALYIITVCCLYLCTNPPLSPSNQWRKLWNVGLRTVSQLCRHVLKVQAGMFFFDTVEDINELIDAISSYVTFCVDLVVPTKKVIWYPNNKPWITKELKSVINKKKQTYFTEDPQERKIASREVQNEIRRAKAKYKEKK